MSLSGSARGRTALTKLPASLRERTAVENSEGRHLRPPGALVMLAGGRHGFGRAGDLVMTGLDRVVAVNWAVGSWRGWGLSGSRPGAGPIPLRLPLKVSRPRPVRSFHKGHNSGPLWLFHACKLRLISSLYLSESREGVTCIFIDTKE